MAKQVKSLDDMPVDPVDAVKRGLMRRGLFSSRRIKKRNSGSETSNSVREESGPVKEKNKSENIDPEGPRGKDQEVSRSSDESEPGEVHEKLIEMTENAHDVLFTADTFFLLTLVPDTITLDREKLTVVDRYFYRIAKITTVPISSMISADVSVGPFFGSVHMTSKYFIDNTHTVRFLWRKDAEEIHRLLQGFIIAH
jgi:hypothetical protein